jgi:hypothetical protein
MWCPFNALTDLPSRLGIVGRAVKPLGLKAAEYVP